MAFLQPNDWYMCLRIGVACRVQQKHIKVSALAVAFFVLAAAARLVMYLGHISKGSLIPIAKVAEALLGGHDVAELVALRQRALDGSCMEVVLAAAGVDVRQLPLVPQPLRLIDVIGAPSPLQGGSQVPPVLQQLQGCANTWKQAARLAPGLQLGLQLVPLRH